MLDLREAMFGVWQKLQAMARSMFAQAGRIISRVWLDFDAILDGVGFAF
jgi:hypothetical protein